MTAHPTTDELLTPGRSAELLAGVRAEISRVIVGQQRVVERVLVGLLAGGHCLLEGAPGLGKTRLLTTLATSMGGEFNRIQFTPDLLPSDIVGTRIWRQEESRFTVELGPVFANFVLADEINRAPAKVQSALLEVMAEKQVTIGGDTYPVERPFLVLATQNPIESEGVYQLPEAQRDRFLMKVPVDYPAGPHEEMEIVRRAAGDEVTPQQVISLDEVKALQATTRAIHVDPRVADYAVRLVLASREPARQGLDSLSPLIAFGASPRASIGLVEGGRALALLRGRGSVEPQDIYDIGYDVLNHRLVLSFDAVADGVTVDEVLYQLLTTIPAPQLGNGQYGGPPQQSSPPRIPDAGPPVPGTAAAGLQAAGPYRPSASSGQPAMPTAPVMPGATAMPPASAVPPATAFPGPGLLPIGQPIPGMPGDEGGVVDDDPFDTAPEPPSPEAGPEEPRDDDGSGDAPGMSGAPPPGLTPGTPLRPEAFGRLELAVRRKLEGRLHGEYQGLLPGHGSEPGEARRYRPGDDVRRIDWAVTARTNHAHVRETIADHELTAVGLIDLSGSQHFGTARRQKRDVALEVLGAFGFITAHGANRFGAMVLHPHGEQWFPPRQGRQHVHATLQRIARLPRVTAREAGGPTGVDLSGALRRIARLAPRRGGVVVISDFLDGSTGRGPERAAPWSRSLRALAERHEVIAVDVVDPRELNLPKVGYLTLIDPESGRRRVVDTNDTRTRLAYAEAARAQRDRIGAQLRRAGASHLTVRTDADWLADVVRYVERRRRAPLSRGASMHPGGGGTGR